MSKYLALVGLVGLAGCASHRHETREERHADRARARANLSLDRDFLFKAASGGKFEVESSRLAISRRPEDETVQFAQIMIRDHSRANGRLELLANAEGVSLPARMLPEHRATLEELRAAPSDRFSDVYERVQTRAHRDTIALFERCAKHCRDRDVRAYAAETLPTLRQHLRHVRELRATAHR